MCGDLFTSALHITINGTFIVAAVTNLQTSRPRKDFTLFTDRPWISKYSVTSFATPRVLGYLYSPEIHCSWCDIVFYCCDLEVCNLVTVTLVYVSSVTSEIWAQKVLCVCVCGGGGVSIYIWTACIIFICCRVTPSVLFCLNINSETVDILDVWVDPL
jgi:hypothetical protein